jgi:hypothetical protein
MSFFNNKPRPAQVPPRPAGLPGSGTHAANAPRPAHSVAVAKAGASSAAPAAEPKSGRQSNGLKEFLWQLQGIGHGHLLDMGSARQTTITFFIERGFKVYTEDLLPTWQRFLEEDEQQAKKLTADADRSEMSPKRRAERFLESSMAYKNDTFDAVLMWDILDYLDTELMNRLAARIASLVRDGGVVFAMFHARKPTVFHRYRVMDGHNLELIPASCPFQPQRVFQNREISNLFGRFRTSKMFVGRDQLREGLFVK